MPAASLPCAITGGPLGIGRALLPGMAALPFRPVDAGITMALRVLAASLPAASPGPVPG